MLIDLEPPRTIVPAEFPGRLVLALLTGGDKKYGIRPANPEESPPEALEHLGQGMHAFEIPLDPTQEETTRYKATSWHHDVYHGEIPTITLIEVRKIDSGFAVSFHTPNENPIVVHL